MSNLQTVKGTGDSYETQRKIGEGGFGETFLATAQSDGSAVVLKRLRIERLEDWKALELFEREARVLATLEHPNIPRYVDAFEDADGGGLVLVQEYVEGKTLRASLQDGMPLEEAVMTRWLLKVLEVCAYLHALDPPVIHRDVNPNNIILRDGDTEPFLIDFGTVQAAIRAESDISSTAAGTFGYAPTEQFIGKAYPSSDLFGLAMTFLAVWTGIEPEQMPFARGEVQLDALLADRPLDGRIRLAIERMIDRIPENRPQSAGEVLARLAPLRDKAVAVRRDTPSEDAATSNPWREAKARLDRLDSASLLGTARARDDRTRVGNWALSADSRQMLVMAAERALLIDTDTMAVVQTLELNGDDAIGFAPDHSFLIAFNGWDEYMTRVELPDGTSATSSISEELQSSSYGGLDAPIAISPDGKLGATGSPLALFDTTSGTLIRMTDIESETRPCFSPDGRTLVGCGLSKVVIMAIEGGVREIDGTCLAFSPDGRRVAVVVGNESCEVLIGPWDQLDSSSSWSDQRFTLPLPSRSEVRHLCFDPSGRWLAIGAEVMHTPPATPADWSWGRRVLVLDTHNSAIVADFGDPSRGGSPLGRVYGLGFDAASTRLFVFVNGFPMLHGSDEYVVLVHGLQANRLLAVIDPDGIRTPEGFAAPFRGGKPAKGPYADLALRAACGDASEDDLADDARDALLDLRQRLEFLGRLFGARTEPHGIALPHESDMRPLIDATKGLTHMLPWILTDARERAADAPAFGAAKGEPPLVRLTHVLAAAQALAERSESERDALFEEMAELDGTTALASSPRPVRPLNSDAGQARAALIVTKPTPLEPSKPSGHNVGLVAVVVGVAVAVCAIVFLSIFSL